MKVIMLIGRGANQKALANRINEIAPLYALALIDMPKRKSAPKFLTRMASVSVGLPLRTAWKALFRHYDKLYPCFPPVPMSSHQGVNSATVLELVKNTEPDIILVSGTDLLGQELIAAVGSRIMNLHTGISPHVKGGPNCTNWALALGEFDLIGNTIMWLDAGIDSGNIIATERTPLTGKETLSELHLRVMDHAHDLYCRCVKKFAEGAPLNSVPQSQLGRGRLFLTRHWTASKIVAAVFNFYASYSPERLGRASPALVSIAKGA